MKAAQGLSSPHLSLTSSGTQVSPADANAKVGLIHCNVMHYHIAWAAAWDPVACIHSEASHACSVWWQSLFALPLQCMHNAAQYVRHQP